MATTELPEPLRAAVDGVADLMASDGATGTYGKDGARQHYRRLAEVHREGVLVALRARVEGWPAGRTVREADSRLYVAQRDRNNLFWLVVCDASRPERPVTVLRSTDVLYIVSAPKGDSLGLVVSKSAARSTKGER